MSKKLILILCIWCLATSIGFAADITVKSVVINSSEILTDAEIRAITSKLEGQTVGLDELQNTIDELNALYIQKNYVTARAILGSPEVVDGVVRIQLVEGRVGEFLVQNNQSTKASFFTNRIGLKPGDLVRLDTLERDISFFNQTNDVQMAAELTAGKEFGQTDCILKVSEPNKHPVSVYTDNGGRGETGLYRIGMNVVDNSFLGVRDKLALSGIFASGTVGVSAIYDRPVGIRGSRFSLNYDYSETNIVSGTFETVDIFGYSASLGVKLSQPFVANEHFSQYGSLEWRSNKADNFFSGVKLIDTEYQKVTASIGAETASDTQVIYMQHDLTAGVVKESETTDYVKYSGSLTLQRLLTDGLILTCRGTFQLTPDKLLPSAEEFSIGGMATVRGYSEGALTGDKGYFVSVELSQQVSPRVTGIVFVDHGAAFPFKGNDEPIASTDYAISVGIGTVVNFTDYIAGKCVVGFPVRQERSPQVHLLIQASF